MHWIIKFPISFVGAILAVAAYVTATIVVFGMFFGIIFPFTGVFFWGALGDIIWHDSAFGMLIYAVGYIAVAICAGLAQLTASIYNNLPN